MNTSYVYSATRLNTLGTELLSQTDMDRLLVAQPGAELASALKETYLAPYVLQVQNEDVAEAIEATLVEAKQLIQRIAPDGDVFRVLWVQYDIHNLRVFAKATKTGKSFDELSSYTSDRGIYTPADIHAHAEAGTLNRLQIDWQVAYDAALRHVEAGSLDLVDGVFDELLFTTIKRTAAKHGDRFVQRYVAAVIDTYNAKATLRRLRLGSITMQPEFVTGGTFAASELTNVDSVTAAFETLSPSFFSSAVAAYTATGNTSELDARIDDYLVSLTKSAATDMFTSASLVLYYLRARQAATNIRTIVVGLGSGMDTDAIRANLRTAYVNN
jgi:V/A-type H+-transporting ATPase subunit C